MVGFTNKAGTLVPATLYKRMGNDIVSENNLRMFKNIGGQIVEFPQKNNVGCAYDDFCIKDRNPFNGINTSGGSFGFDLQSSGAGRGYRPRYEQTKQTIAQIKSNISNVVYKENGIFSVRGGNAIIVGPDFVDGITLGTQWMLGDGATGTQNIIKTSSGGNVVFLQFDTNRIEIGVDGRVSASYTIPNHTQFIQDFHTFTLRIDQPNLTADAYIDGVKRCSFNGTYFGASNAFDYVIGGGNGVVLYKNLFGWRALLTDAEVLASHRWVTNQ